MESALADKLSDDSPLITAHRNLTRAIVAFVTVLTVGVVVSIILCYVYGKRIQWEDIFEVAYSFDPLSPGDFAPPFHCGAIYLHLCH